MQRPWIAIAGMVLALTTGCQCCPVFDSYANVVDDVNDTHLYFDRWYNPRWDITRMGKPDWCSAFNRRFCERCCNNGCYDRYDECNLYPPLYPYEYPSNIMPPPTVRTKRHIRALDVDPYDQPLPMGTSPDAAPVPAHPKEL
ncbi:hypothetical protein [Schlesneria paludicola]|uniref:hypothetical protein n=1 Tax=Schlesneria paludicola TaxID=360056 RepID=UPI000299E1A6|nr:hypothetical protein [Schlesneria paludicola]